MRKKWKCEICGFETMGYGVYSHKERHRRENSLIDFARQNEKNKMFNALIQKYEPNFIILEKKIMEIGKITSANYPECIVVKDYLFQSDIPNEDILFFVSNFLNSRYLFSNTSYEKFKNEIGEILKKSL